MLTPIVYLNGNYKYFKSIEDVAPEDTIKAILVVNKQAQVRNSTHNFEKSRDKRDWSTLATNIIDTVQHLPSQSSYY